MAGGTPYVVFDHGVRKGPNPANSAPAGHLLGPVVRPPAPLAPYATRPADSRGRFYPETESATRTCYSRDRDRIIHSTAFRRLKHKTQVFVQHEGDYYRTRLTHSLEVAQLARSLARSLAVDEDLAETVALAHDLGHTPFGHAGEEALDAVTADIGGFDHNAHALRLVTKLEHRYADFDGLNLTWETLEGLVKHNGPITAAVPGPDRGFRCALAAGSVTAGRGWKRRSRRWPTISPMSITTSTMACAPALFTVADLTDAPLAGAHVRAVLARYGELELSRFIGELIRTLMSALMDDLRAETGARLAAAQPQSARRCAAAGRALVALFARACWSELQGAQGLSVHPHVPPSPGDGLDDPGQGGGHRPVRGLCRRSRASAAGLGRNAARGRLTGGWCATISPA